jgi:hypothetical protein
MQTERVRATANLAELNKYWCDITDLTTKLLIQQARTELVDNTITNSIICRTTKPPWSRCLMPSHNMITVTSYSTRKQTQRASCKHFSGCLPYFSKLNDTTLQTEQSSLQNLVYMSTKLGATRHAKLNNTEDWILKKWTTISGLTRKWGTINFKINW